MTTPSEWLLDRYELAQAARRREPVSVSSVTTVALSGAATWPTPREVDRLDKSGPSSSRLFHELNRRARDDIREDV